MPIILSSGQVAERTAYFLELGLVPSRIELGAFSYWACCLLVLSLLSAVLFEGPYQIFSDELSRAPFYVVSLQHMNKSSAFEQCDTG